jgi:hypothetical protein
MSRTPSRRGRRREEPEPREQVAKFDLDVADKEVSLPQIAEEQLVEVDLGEMYEIDLGLGEDGPLPSIVEAATACSTPSTMQGEDQEESDSIEGDITEEDFEFYQWSPKEGVFSPVPWVEGFEVSPF